MPFTMNNVSLLCVSLTVFDDQTQPKLPSVNKIWRKENVTLKKEMTLGWKLWAEKLPLHFYNNSYIWLLIPLKQRRIVYLLLPSFDLILACCEKKD